MAMDTLGRTVPQIYDLHEFLPCIIFFMLRIPKHFDWNLNIA